MLLSQVYEYGDKLVDKIKVSIKNQILDGVNLRINKEFDECKLEEL